MYKRSLLFLLVVIIILTIFLIAFSNLSEITVNTAFGRLKSSVFILILFSFILGAFSMFILQVLSSKEGIELKKGGEKISYANHLKEANIFYAHDQYEEAEKELNRISNIYFWREGVILKIKTLLKLEKYLEAKEAAEIALTNFSNDIELLYLVYEIYYKLRILEKAKEILRSIVTLDPRDSYKAYKKLMDLYIEANNWIDAIKTYEDIIYHFPDKIDAKQKNIYYGLCYKLALQFIEEEHYREATYYAKELQNADEQFSLSYYLLGKIYFIAKDERNFIKIITKGILKTKKYCLMKLMEDYYLSEYNPGAVIEFYKNLIYETKRDEIIILALGLYYQRIEMIDEAIKIYQELHLKYPNWHELALLKAQLFLRMSEGEKALQNFEEFFSNNNLPALFICSKCGNKSFSYEDKCGNCDWWDSINLTKPVDEKYYLEPALWAESI